MAPSKRKVSKQSSGGSDDEDYRKKRDRNNQVRVYFQTFYMDCFVVFNFDLWLIYLFVFPFKIYFQAVKRSRVKTKEKTCLTKDRVDSLKRDNEKLQERIATKTRNLETLKSLFLETAKAKSESNKQNFDLKKLLADSDDEA